MLKFKWTLILTVSFLLMLIYPKSIEAQVITSNEVDAFTGTARIDVDITDRGIRARNRDFIDSNNEILPRVSYLKLEDGSEIFLFNLVVRNLSGCLSQYSGKILLLFEDSEVVSLGQISETECSSEKKLGRFVMGVDDPAIEEDDRFDENTSTDNGYYIPNLLTEKRIDKIRVYGSEGYRDYEIREDEKETIQNSLKLLLNEIPSE